MPAKKDPTSYKQLTTTQRKQARNVRRLQGEDVHRWHVERTINHNNTVWKKKGMAVKEGHLHPVQKKLLKAVKKTFGCTTTGRFKSDKPNKSNLPKHPVNYKNDFMWHSSDDHMRKKHRWTTADCNHAKSEKRVLETTIIGAGLRPDTFFVRITAASKFAGCWYNDHVGAIMEVESKPIGDNFDLAYRVANRAWEGNLIKARDCIWYAHASTPVKGAKKAHGVQAGPHAFTEFIKKPYILDEKKDDFNWLTDGSHGEGLPHSASKALKKAVDNWDPLAEAERKEKELEALGKTAREAAEIVNQKMKPAADYIKEQFKRPSVNEVVMTPVKQFMDKYPETCKEILVQTDKRHDPTIYNLYKEEEAKRMSRMKECSPGCETKEARKPGPIQEQLQELGKALCIASEMLDRLENKLQPVRYVPPRPADDSGKAEGRSDIFNAIKCETGRVNDLCKRIMWLEEEIEL